MRKTLSESRRAQPFHAGNRSSNLRGDANENALLARFGGGAFSYCSNGAPASIHPTDTAAAQALAQWVVGGG